MIDAGVNENMSGELTVWDLDEAKIAELAESALAALELPPEKDLENLRSRLRHVLENWVGDQIARSISGAPKDQRLLLRALAHSIAKTLHLMARLGPEYAAAVSRDDMDDTDIFERARQSLDRLHRRIGSFDEAYNAGKGPADSALDEAVRDLLELFDSEGLPPPRVRQGRQGVEPALLSREATAIALLLQSTVEGPATRTLVNKIREIQKGRPPIEAHLQAIFRASDDAAGVLELPRKKSP